jgi:hypothetical protein
VADRRRNAAASVFSGSACKARREVRSGVQTELAKVRIRGSGTSSTRGGTCPCRWSGETGFPMLNPPERCSSGWDSVRRNLLQPALRVDDAQLYRRHFGVAWSSARSA